MSEKPMNERVGILEVQMENHATRLEENQLISNKLIEKLDAHMVAGSERDIKLQDNLVQVTIAVTQLSTTVEATNITLKKIAKIVDDDATTIRDWKTVTRTACKMIGITVSLVIGLWVVGTYLYDHKELLPITAVAK